VVQCAVKIPEQCATNKNATDGSEYVPVMGEAIDGNTDVECEHR
jgi:hypothetical protein